jgi:hypothetical protein
MGAFAMPNYVQMEEFAARAARNFAPGAKDIEDLAVHLSQKVTRLMEGTPPIHRAVGGDTLSDVQRFLTSRAEPGKTFAMAYPERSLMTGPGGTLMLETRSAIYTADSNIYVMSPNTFVVATPTTSGGHLRVEEWSTREHSPQRGASYATSIQDFLSPIVTPSKTGSGAKIAGETNAMIETAVSSSTNRARLFMNPLVTSRVATVDGAAVSPRNNFVPSDTAIQAAAKPMQTKFDVAAVGRFVDRPVRTNFGEGNLLGVDHVTGEAFVELRNTAIRQSPFYGELDPKGAYTVGLAGKPVIRDLQGRLFVLGSGSEPNLDLVKGVGVVKPSEARLVVGTNLTRMDEALGIFGDRQAGLRAQGGYLSDYGSRVKLER